MINNIIKFKIRNIDSFGQGVSDLGDKVVFIPKTLIGEEGTAIIIGKKKNVLFAQIKTIIKTSKDRITPECKHYHECNGCSYLHTSYDIELQSKINAAKFFLRSIICNNITVIKADSRFYYRNRVQLHYDLKKTSLGFISSNNKITVANNCLLPLVPIKNEIDKLYKNNKWKEYVRKNKGHVEISYDNGKSNVIIDQNYASEGFSQINDSMNKVFLIKLKEELSKYSLDYGSILDLFGGNGNLSTFLFKESDNITVVDKFIHNPKYGKFIKCDIFNKESLENLLYLVNKKINTIILDPPRSGMKDLSFVVEKLSPEYIVYVSCAYSTQKRDLVPLLDNYELLSYIFVDFFPGTHHIETCAILKKNKLIIDKG